MGSWRWSTISLFVIMLRHQLLCVIYGFWPSKAPSCFTTNALFCFFSFVSLVNQMGKSHCFQVIGILDALMLHKKEKTCCCNCQQWTFWLIYLLPTWHSWNVAYNITKMGNDILPFFSSMQDWKRSNNNTTSRNSFERFDVLYRP